MKNPYVNPEFKDVSPVDRVMAVLKEDQRIKPFWNEFSMTGPPLYMRIERMLEEEQAFWALRELIVIEKIKLYFDGWLAGIKVGRYYERRGI